MARRNLITLKRAASEFREDNLADWAAALTYYALLSLFPALIALVSVVGLVGDPEAVTRSIRDVVSSIAPGSATRTFAGPIESITSDRSAAGVSLIFGLAVALWSASGYVGAFMRASNVIYEKAEGRPFWKLRPLQLLVTLAMVVMFAVVALALVLTGPVADAIADEIGVGSTATTIWSFVKWPVLALVFVTMVSVLYYASPNAKLRGFAWLSPGSLLALLVWVVASLGFAAFVASFGSYGRTYGALAGVVVLLVWLWFTNIAILFGHQLNAERERTLEIESGVPLAKQEIQLEARSPATR